MRKELDYFRIENFYGGYQEWFPDYMMRIGGCAAVAACDSCIFFDFYKETRLYPYDLNNLTKQSYIRFGMEMKPYLRPRWSGIDTLELFINGFQEYLTDHDCQKISMDPFYGSEPVKRARKEIIQRIEEGFPVPYLVLNHRNPSFHSFEWHWFLLTGYELLENKCMVKAVTYGRWYWLELEKIWDTGYARKGGLILYH